MGRRLGDLTPCMVIDLAIHYTYSEPSDLDHCKQKHDSGMKFRGMI